MLRNLFEYHPKTGFRFIPNLKTRVPHEGGGYLVSTNPQGFRSNHDFTHQKSDEKFRILLFGDSYTAGQGVSNGNRFSDVLENKIPNLEIFNFGLPGTGTDQQFLAFEEFASQIQGVDALVLVVFVENIRRIKAKYRVWSGSTGEPKVFQKPFFSKTESGALQLHNSPPSPTPILISELKSDQIESVDQGGKYPKLRSLIKKWGLQKIAEKMARYQPVPEYDSPSDPSWNLMQAIILQWVDRFNAIHKQKKFVVVPLPVVQHLEEISSPLPYQTRFQEFAKKTGIQVFDPLPSLFKHSLKERKNFRFKNDPHFNENGHTAFAEALLPLIEILKR